MMYGAQSDKFDYHMVGFDEPILNYFLTKDGLYCDVQRVGSFNLFNDTRYDWKARPTHTVNLLLPFFYPTSFIFFVSHSPLCPSLLSYYSYPITDPITSILFTTLSPPHSSTTTTTNTPSCLLPFLFSSPLLSSELVYLNRKISLNMVAKKCGGGLNGDDFKIDHNASPYVPE